MRVGGGGGKGKVKGEMEREWGNGRGRRKGEMKGVRGRGIGEHKGRDGICVREKGCNQAPTVHPTQHLQLKVKPFTASGRDGDTVRHPRSPSPRHAHATCTCTHFLPPLRDVGLSRGRTQRKRVAESGHRLWQSICRWKRRL